MGINAHYHHACALTLSLRLLSSLEKAVGTTPAHWHRDLVTGMESVPQCWLNMTHSFSGTGGFWVLMR